MSEFKPLDMQRAIRDDDALRGSEKGLLWAAVLRTDNRTRKVRASLELLAKDAGFHPNTAKATFSDGNKPVMRYFERVERSKRVVNLWFHPVIASTVTVRSGVSRESTVSVRSEEVWETVEISRAQSACAGSTTTVRSEHSECAPSACISASTAVLSRPSSLQGDEQTEGQAAPEETVEMCEMHISFPADTCHYPHEARPSSLSPDKQKELDAKWMIAEGIDPNTGMPVYQDRLPLDRPQSRRRL